jgi:hypothetical protein
VGRDVAAGDDRHVHQVDELGRQRVIRRARVHLPRGPRVQRQRRRARVDQARTDLEAGAGPVLEPAAHLDRNGRVHGARNRLDDAARSVRILEQRRTGAGLRHLPDGAPEVDVDDVGAGALDHARRLGHQRRLRAEDLDGEGMLV